MAASLKGTIAIIGDYDEDSDTYCVSILADAKQVDASGLSEHNDVLVTLDCDDEKESGKAE